MSAIRRFYLAGPMTGIEGHNFTVFDKATLELRNLGYEVISTAEIARSLPGTPGDLPYHTYVREDLKGLLECTDIVMLPGWGGSRGARRELEIADFLFMKCWRYVGNGALQRMEYGDQRV